MEIKENSQKKVLLSVLGVAILVVAVVGISFAAFNLSTLSDENSVSTGTLMVSYSEDAKEINITDAMPMSDADALSSANLKADNESFAFTVSTSADNAVSIPYSISITPVVETGDVLANSQIKVHLTKGGTQVLAPTLVSALGSYTGHSRTGSYLLYSDTDSYTKAGSTTSEYLLKMWIDGDVTLDNTKTYTYKAKVNVDSDVTPIE